ncbi:DUF2065 domain-containing protein [Roseomonas sp. OT10]|uniref:DUF2065 domain-containing protein n=1 Tax=Roseomonas cutis TaxID=2897332 RepID=UPI001E42CE45|nr:DUF2065 domain-containing protein [Roseomonas sp. OT10]UFN50567.1 DUF2065 domain-containing protein [Roseomonas sp. OT10]
MTGAQLLAGLGVALALEGLAYAVAPGLMRRAVATLAATPEERLRLGGLVAAVLGIGAAFLLTHAHA